MARFTLREIMYEYANQRGGGLPLTAEEMCNALALWVEGFVEDTYEELPNSAFYVKVRDALIHAIQTEKPLEKEITYQQATAVDMTVKLPIENLIEMFEGSETIVVDINEQGDKIEIHLDGEVTAKINRAILQPIANPVTPSVPVVQPNGSVTYEPFGSGGGGTQLYRHEIRFSGSNNVLIVVSPYSEPFSNSNVALLPYVTLFGKYALTSSANDYYGSFVTGLTVEETSLAWEYISLLGTQEVFMNIEEYPILPYNPSKI